MTIQLAGTKGYNQPLQHWRTTMINRPESVGQAWRIMIQQEAEIILLRAALQEIANEDFRGNRSTGSQKAFRALEKANARKADYNDSSLGSSSPANHEADGLERD